MNTATGRAKTVLVFGGGHDAMAVISSVVVHAWDDPARERIRFTGPVVFDEPASGHMASVILPVVEKILGLLGQKRMRFEVSVVNLGAASVTGTGARISGFSADVPVLLALLSAGLEMPVPDDMVCTGHIASSDGDIALVSNIPAKLEAAIGDPAIRRFVYPSLDRDTSLSALSPGERQRAADAVVGAKDEIDTVGVGDVEELLRAVFSDEAVVLAGLRKGFFDIQFRCASPSPVERAARFLADKNQDRFWTALEHNLLAGENDKTQELLLAQVEYHISRKTYPRGLGQRLFRIVQSLPPATRRVKTVFPLLPMEKCIELSQHASASDHEDVIRLYDAALGRTIRKEPGQAVQPGPGSEAPSGVSGSVSCGI